jgi:hypothetical protein
MVILIIFITGFCRRNEEKIKENDHYNYQKHQIVCIQLLWIVTIFNYYGALLNIRNVGAMSLAIRTTMAGKCKNNKNPSNSNRFSSGSAELIGATTGLCLLLRAKFKFGILGIMMLISGSCCVASWAITPDGKVT